jgi:hypothetical protein
MGSEWPWVELAIHKVIEDKNRELIESARKPIERLHAGDMSSFVGDFKDWNGNERTEFTKRGSSALSVRIKAEVSCYQQSARFKQSTFRLFLKRIQVVDWHRLVRSSWLKLHRKCGRTDLTAARHMLLEKMGAARNDRPVGDTII